MNKNIELANYLIKHKDLRVWQNIRNWSKYSKIYGEYYYEKVDDDIIEDTFYK